MSLSPKNVFAAMLAFGVPCGCSGYDADTEIDTSFEFGDTTPCVNEARPGEVCAPGGNYRRNSGGDDPARGSSAYRSSRMSVATKQVRFISN